MTRYKITDRVCDAYGAGDDIALAQAIEDLMLATRYDYRLNQRVRNKRAYNKRKMTHEI